MRHRESSLDRAAGTALVGAVCLALLTVSHAQDRSMNSLAEQYVRLVLAVGQHDADYVDAYYGPPEWRKEAEARKLPLTEIASRAASTACAVPRRSRWMNFVAAGDTRLASSLTA